jgi:proteasome lid subunit RPN8/RPN11
MSASRLLIPAEAVAMIEREARNAFPGECCGLLEGTRENDALEILRIHPTRNLSTGSDRFEVDPREQIALMCELRGTAREIIGCYHSHPNGREEPSLRDAESAAERGFIWIIAALGADTPVAIRAFAFTGSGFDPLPIYDPTEEPAWHPLL